MARTAPISVERIPQSWALKRWDTEATHVHPGTAKRARKLVKRHRAALVKHGAIAKIGRDTIMIGAGYASFLTMCIGQSAFEVPAGIARARAQAAAQAATAAASAVPAQTPASTADGASDAVG